MSSISSVESVAMLERRVKRVAAALEASFFDHFALCPFLGTRRDLAFYTALQEGLIPVVITDAFRLPDTQMFDSSAFSIWVGTSISELELLRSIERMEIDQVESMKAAGRAALKYFGEQQPLPELSDVVFPNRLDDGRLLRESEILRHMWRSISGRILIFGAGRFLQRFMESTNDGRGAAQIVGIADDAVGEETVRYGYALAHGEHFDRDSFDAVLLATDSLEERFAQRVREIYGHGVELLRPSVLMQQAREAGAGDDEEFFEPAEVPPPARFPSKLEGVVVSVGCADFLSWSLPENVKHFDQLVVVTSADDLQTQQVAKSCGATLCISDVHREGGAVFNKGKMINAGFDALDMDGWVLVTDADILFRSGMRRRLFSRMLNEYNLYYATRFNTPALNREEWLESYLDSSDRFQELAFEDPQSNQMPWGYFQLFHGSCGHRYAETFETAGEVDYEFQQRWPQARRVLLPEGCIHIHHGDFAVNWAGRKSVPLKLRTPVSRP